MSSVKQVFQTLLDFIYPPHCAICEASIEGGAERIVCSTCWGKVDLVVPPWCRRCGQTSERHTEVCPACEEWRYRFSRIRTMARFEGVVQDLIHLLKYQGKRSIAKRLGAVLADRLLSDSMVGRIDLLIPVPLHSSRERERGYNQSALIARAVGEHLGVPVEERVLQRVKNTQTQTQLSASERAANVAGAFRVRGPEVVAGRRVALVDDVVTTGATADACAEALIATGASEILLLALAAPHKASKEDSEGGCET